MNDDEDQSSDINDILISLPEDDQNEYYNMKQWFNNFFRKHSQKYSLSDICQIIKQFCIKNDEFDQIRCRLCGICWYKNEIGIHYIRFRNLTGQSKSNINYYFNENGYESAIKLKKSTQIRQIYDFLKISHRESRQWLTIQNSIQSHNDKTYHPNSYTDHVWSYEDFNIHSYHEQETITFFDDSFCCTLQSWSNQYVLK